VADKSTIEWTDATWNPVRGCSRITTGCGGPNHEGGCYAEKIAARFSDPGQPFHGFAERTPHGGRWTGKLALIEDQLTLPLRWKKPRRIFVNSMSDLFHESLPDEAIDRVFAVMALSPQHTFQVLTKRAARMRDYCSQLGRHHSIDRVSLAMKRYHPNSPGAFYTLENGCWHFANVWLGVSAERQEEADERIPHLMNTPAAVRFISAEPLLGPIDLIGTLARYQDSPQKRGCSVPLGRQLLDWIIVGGESGSKARPMHPQWAQDIRDQCAEAGVPFFFKQWGEWTPHKPVAGGDLGGDVRAGRVRIVHPTGQSDVEVSIATGGHSTIPGSRYMARIGKKAAGRSLDGREHSEFPKSMGCSHGV
jgi:protein gp37